MRTRTVAGRKLSATYVAFTHSYRHARRASRGLQRGPQRLRDRHPQSTRPNGTPRSRPLACSTPKSPPPTRQVCAYVQLGQARAREGSEALDRRSIVPPMLTRCTPLRVGDMFRYLDTDQGQSMKSVVSGGLGLRRDPPFAGWAPANPTLLYNSQRLPRRPRPSSHTAYR